MGKKSKLEHIMDTVDNGNVPMKCPQEDCGYEWEYTGDKRGNKWSDGAVTCPSCGNKCLVGKNRKDTSNND